MSIYAEAYGTLCIAGFEESLETLRPFFAIALLTAVKNAVATSSIISIEIVIAVDYLESTSVNKTLFSFSFGGEKWKTNHEQCGAKPALSVSMGHSGRPLIVYFILRE